MATRKMEKTAADFREIPLHSLRINSVTNFDIYIKVAARNQEERFVLYRERNIPFSESARKNLTDCGTDILYIDASDEKEYQLYLENNLEAIIKDDEVSHAEKSNAAYQCAIGLVEQLLENPRSGEHVKRSKLFISNLVDYLLSDSHAFFSLMTSMSFNYLTYTHSVNVAVFGIALAHKLGQFTQHSINTIGSGLILHDVGKGLIDPRILDKNGPLNDDEWAVMKRHPADGANLLRSLGNVSEQALIIVEGHHEKLDGSGYPRGIRGVDVHQYARIAAIADIFDALTTRRPYRPALRSFEALELMKKEMSEQLDRDLLREFILLLGDRAARI
ncbi:MAG: HD domain-containing protein [Candidatus Abyssobacteria bacterium SURF_17]|uniref:HD domain-containing protein n=1 Tax=Candidatus Abyssobacteria bacterium SURF_17 TaxID=2093361 RepID=A0A419F3R0_9BACT|nr:MAG: HD domain-containing protein [Candidatus Abyssubacteria bacterium SURF_17]